MCKCEKNWWMSETTTLACAVFHHNCKTTLKIWVKSFAVTLTKSDWLLRNKELHYHSTEVRRCENNCIEISPLRLFSTWQHSIREQQSWIRLLLSPLVWQIWRNDIQAEKHSIPGNFPPLVSSGKCCGWEPTPLPMLAKPCSHNGFWCANFYQIILTDPD